MMNLTFTLNGETASVEIDPGARLVDVLRNTLGMTGTKVGCEEGECGACTVVVDGLPVNSCLYPAAEVEGRDVLTIEGHAVDETLRRVVDAFVAHGAVQCGFCTPGMIMCAYAFLRDHPDSAPEAIRRSVEGNICRCTGYVKILEAIESLAAQAGESRL